MKRALILCMVASLALVVMFGCGGSGEQQGTEGKVNVEVKEAEQADSTRLDSAMDTVKAMVDSAEAILESEVGGQ